jgi:hypothetical protein
VNLAQDWGGLLQLHTFTAEMDFLVHSLVSANWNCFGTVLLASLAIWMYTSGKVLAPWEYAALSGVEDPPLSPRLRPAPLPSVLTWFTGVGAAVSAARFWWDLDGWLLKVAWVW